MDYNHIIIGDAVEIGNKVPGITLVDTDLKQVNLAEAVKGKKTVLAFFPGAFTSVCTKEMCTFRDDMSKLESLRANAIGISVDDPFSNKAFKEHNKLNFTLLSDFDRNAVKAFGIELKDFAGLRGYTAAKRSVFVADAGGTIRYRWVSDDPRVEPNYDEVRAALAKI